MANLKYVIYFPDPSLHDDMKREPEPIFSVYTENILSLEDVFSNIAPGSGLSRVENNSAANENIGPNIEHRTFFIYRKVDDYTKSTID